PEEIRRHGADDGERDPIERHPPADDVEGGAKPALPERVADDGDRAVRTAAGLIVGAGERPADERRDAERVEHARRSPDAVDEFGDAAVGDVEARAVGPREGAVE